MRQGMAGGMDFRGQTERDRVGFDGGTPLSVTANTAFALRGSFLSLKSGGTVILIIAPGIELLGDFFISQERRDAMREHKREGRRWRLFLK